MSRVSIGQAPSSDASLCKREKSQVHASGEAALKWASRRSHVLFVESKLVCCVLREVER